MEIKYKSVVKYKTFTSYFACDLLNTKNVFILSILIRHSIWRRHDYECNSTLFCFVFFYFLSIWQIVFYMYVLNFFWLLFVFHSTYGHQKFSFFGNFENIFNTHLQPSACFWLSSWEMC